MAHLDLWKLSTEYSLVHAALIISGNSPEATERDNESDFPRKFPGYLAAKTALYNAVLSGALKTVKLVTETYEYEESSHLDIYRTLIAASELDAFLRGRGMVCDFFERPEGFGSSSESFSGTCFPAKLDAANRAWRAVTSDPSKLAGKSPKQALEKWLTENAFSLGLINKDGLPNKTGIEEICKVANWKPGGGATPTPSIKDEVTATLVRLPGPQSDDSPPRRSFSIDLDDEIPF